MHNHHASAINESMLFSSKERPSKQAMYQSSFIFFFASQRIVKHRSALARPTNTTAICNTGNTSGTWGRLIDWLTEGPRNRETGLANLRNIGGPVFVAILASVEHCDRPGKPSLDGALSLLCCLTCCLSGVLLTLLGSREPGGMAVFSHRFVRSLCRERAGGEGGAWLEVVRRCSRFRARWILIRILNIPLKGVNMDAQHSHT